MVPHSDQSEATKAVTYKALKVSSSAFKANASIPVKYTCDGEDVNPPLDIDGIPENAKSLAIIVEDPDAPVHTWTHWVIWNIPVTHHIKEDHVPGLQGINDFSKDRYNGPCPPGGTHHYYFKVYALDGTLDLPVSSNKYNLEKAMSDNIIAFGELIGTYKRK